MASAKKTKTPADVTKFDVVKIYDALVAATLFWFLGGATLFWFLGGAAVHRCDNWHPFNDGFSRRGSRARPETGLSASCWASLTSK
jgi:hypothetical protein